MHWSDLFPSVKEPGETCPISISCYQRGPCVTKDLSPVPKATQQDKCRFRCRHVRTPIGAPAPCVSVPSDSHVRPGRRQLCSVGTGHPAPLRQHRSPPRNTSRFVLTLTTESKPNCLCCIRIKFFYLKPVCTFVSKSRLHPLSRDTPLPPHTL